MWNKKFQANIRILAIEAVIKMHNNFRLLLSVNDARI